MEVRCFLSAEDSVVLERQYSQRPIRLDERFCDSFCRDHDGRAFLARKIEQRRDMPTGDDAALANFELPWIDHGQGMFALIDDFPSFFARRHAKVARLSCGKFDHLPSPVELMFRRQPDAWNRPHRERHRPGRITKPHSSDASASRSMRRHTVSKRPVRWVVGPLQDTSATLQLAGYSTCPQRSAWWAVTWMQFDPETADPDYLPWRGGKRQRSSNLG